MIPVNGLAISELSDVPAGSLSGILKASSGAIVAAASGVDYVAPSALSAYALDAAVVHLAGTETVSGAKTFTAPLTVTKQVIAGAGSAGSANAGLESHAPDDTTPAFALYSSLGSLGIHVSPDALNLYLNSAETAFFHYDGSNVQIASPASIFYRASTHFLTNPSTSVIWLQLDGGGAAFAGRLAINGATPPAKPTVTGSRGSNAALLSLLTALASYGLLTDGTTS